MCPEIHLGFASTHQSYRRYYVSVETFPHLRSSTCCCV